MDLIAKNAAITALIWAVTGCAPAAQQIYIVNASWSPCNMQPEYGICGAASHGYYYNDTTDQCLSYLWGGCNGEVPFKHLDACLESCMK